MSSLFPRPRCRCCGTSGAITHWNWCRLPEAERDAHMVSVQRVADAEREYKATVEPVAWSCD